MRCSTCKNCVSAIKNGHIECVETFNYKKSKSAVEAAVRHKQREIYNFFKRSGCPRSFGEELYGCAENNWNAEFFSMLHIPMPDHESQTRHLRASVYACIMHGDYRMLSDCILSHGINTFNNAFDSVERMHNVIHKAIVSKDTQKISKMYHMFSHRSEEWSPTDFDDAIDTGVIEVLRTIGIEWKYCPSGLRGAGNEMKLATIKHNRLDMLRILDQDIHGYPTQMMNEMKTTRGKTTQARKEMIRYVVQREYLVVDRAHERNAERRRALFNTEANIILERQADPVVERVTNLHKALAIIEDCKIPEGKYLELCNLLMDVHRNGVRA